ncbi:putative Rieske (2Fe-2S) domain protein [Microcystis aeruginosa PCC 9432]|jgi:phenylpropionate dioxygenase-like ring-hydroxylating dioxygenase large terminal subunit|uniref:Aromatic ring-hydroxylating dioxygenase subunit alpha n=3 Tax=Microcystis TaxID=1125 RepID=A0A3E0KTV5_9CHRO|nr:aromatic ring-hydroxylating dioxygenase subunit alpha [Microcystis aeruginosa]REJ38728.1 MAG: aromatic ring-hydroxylating dioxygenase subunit alpha [Microcystis flos-aquae TF09]TRT92425.1 MAG: aromatic ring-hydroxylating dioxygenase subunit alpha [Microcystis aeruginosa Ma_OC_LR_19540900_S633]MDB9398152.1 aromatic ring-hydroxylating dioxygenase subunit alpha [Microcystis aeruginosa CS-573]TYT71520.1 aromatic ring-hydroxylating dioxygenase subunit alpha [Microcystis aeruginosa KLA2]CCH95100.
MKTLVPISWYSDPDIFKKEQIVLFQNLWNFVGLTTDLENHNDYIAKDLGGQAIFVQNFRGELRAFDNICSHRFSKIHQEDKGNGPVRCPYHGWIYDSAGIPINIPLQSRFDFSDCTPESFKLKQWLVDTCGSFVFVKKNDDGLTLKEYLGGMYSRLLDFSESMGEKVDCQEMIIKANWKIIVENTLDSYHIWDVHPNSLGKYGAVDGYYWNDDFHSTYLSKAKKLDAKVKKFTTAFADRKLKIDGYQHYLIFPLLTLSTLFGMSLNMHVFTPLSSTETKVTNYTFMGKLDNASLEKILFDMSSKASANLVTQVWDEDKPVCESVQLGMVSIDNSRDYKQGILSSDERRLHTFQQPYLKLMNLVPSAA